MMAKATYPDDTPTPGYLLTDIAKLTVANYTASVQLIEFLVARIKKDNHNIKFKCLQLIRHVCRAGRPDFKREMGRNIDVVKECLQYRGEGSIHTSSYPPLISQPYPPPVHLIYNPGPPDPLTGDKMYERVRLAAKEAIEAIFDSQMPVTSSALQQSNHMGGIGGGYVDDTGSSSNNQNISSKILNSVSNTISILRNDTDAQYTGHPGAAGSFSGGETYAYNPHSSSSSAYGGGNSYMTGIGNAPYSSDSGESFIGRAAAKLADTITNLATIDPITKRSIHDTGDFGYTTNRGPNAYNSAYNPSTSSGGPKTSVWQSAAAAAAAAPTPASSASPGSYGRAGAAASDGTYERGIIEALCDPSGLKAVPQEDKLQAFLGSVTTLSPDVVGGCLGELLNADAWQARSKALQVIHAIAKAPLSSTRHTDYWREENNAEVLVALLSDSKTNVRVNASKVLRALKIDFTESAVVDSGARKSKAPISTGGGVANLLDDDFFSERSTTPPALPALPPAAALQTNIAQLPSLAQVPAAQRSREEDIFNVFDDLPNDNNQAPPQQQQQQQAPSVASNVFDLLDSASNIPSTPVSANTNALIAELSNMTMQIPYSGNQFNQQQQQQQQQQQHFIQQQQQHFSMLHLSQPYRPVPASAPAGGVVGGPMVYPSAMGGVGVDLRKVIPAAADSQNERTTRLSGDGTSGFSFMNSASMSIRAGDSFGFVQDEIKSSKK